MTLPCNPQRVADMRSMIDPCEWCGIVSYLRNPQSEIRWVMLVACDLPLEEVAAFCSEENADVNLYQQMLKEGKIKLANAGPKSGTTPESFTLDSIRENEVFDVICLPPFYIVKKIPVKRDEYAS